MRKNIIHADSHQVIIDERTKELPYLEVLEYVKRSLGKSCLSSKNISKVVERCLRLKMLTFYYQTK